MALSLAPAKTDSRSLRFLPIMTPKTSGRITFLLATEWQGQIKLGERAFNATLSQNLGTIGRFDQPSTRLVLTPVAGPKPRQLYYMFDTLGAFREVDGRYYTVSATPNGDQVTVHPYRGDCGVIEVAAGGRDISKMGVVAILRSKDNTLPLGEMTFPVTGEKRPQYKIPVGDYQPMLMYVDYGPLAIRLAMATSFTPRKPGERARRRLTPLPFARTSRTCSIFPPRPRSPSSPHRKSRRSSRATPSSSGRC